MITETTNHAAIGPRDRESFFYATKAKRSAPRSVRNFILFPVFFTNTAIRLSLWFLSSLIPGPTVALQSQIKNGLNP